MIRGAYRMSIASLPEGLGSVFPCAMSGVDITTRLTDSCERLAILSGELPDESGYQVEWPEGLSSDFRLSLLLTVRNAEATIRSTIARAIKLPVPCEIVVVDDGSTDHTPELLTLLEHQPGVHIVCKPHAQGRGAAIRTGLNHCGGDYIVVLEQADQGEVRDLPALLRPLLQHEADVVYGARHISETSTARYLWEAWLTQLTNRWQRAARTDIAGGLVALRRDILNNLILRESGEAWEAELAAKLARRYVATSEVPLLYANRQRSFSFWSGSAWLWALLRYRWLD